MFVTELTIGWIEYDTQTPQEVGKSATTIVMLIILSLKIAVQFCTYVCFLVSYVNDILHLLIQIKLIIHGRNAEKI